MFLFSPARTMLSLSKTSSSVTPLLLRAANKGDLVTLRRVVTRKGAGVLSTVTAPDGALPIHICAKNGFIECVDFMLGQDGMSMDVRDRDAKRAVGLMPSPMVPHCCIACRALSVEMPLSTFSLYLFFFALDQAWDCYGVGGVESEGVFPCCSQVNRTYLLTLLLLYLAYRAIYFIMPHGVVTSRLYVSCWSVELMLAPSTW